MTRGMKLRAKRIRKMFERARSYNPHIRSKRNMKPGRNFTVLQWCRHIR